MGTKNPGAPWAHPSLHYHLWPHLLHVWRVAAGACMRPMAASVGLPIIAFNTAVAGIFEDMVGFATGDRVSQLREV